VEPAGPGYNGYSKSIHPAGRKKDFICVLKFIK